MGEEAKGGAEGAGGNAGATGDTTKTVPYERFQEVAKKNTELKAEVANLALQLQNAGKAVESATGWQKKAEESEARAKSLEGALDRWKTGAALGISSEDLMGALDQAWQALPTEGRKPFKDVVTGWTEKPDDAPFLLRPHLAQLKGKPAAGATGAGGAKPPKANAGAKVDSSTASQGERKLSDLSPEQQREFLLKSGVKLPPVRQKK